MSRLVFVALTVLVVAGCNDNSNRDMQQNDTLNSQPVDKNPQIDKDPTPETGTGGDQQGAVPKQPAANYTSAPTKQRPGLSKSGSAPDKNTAAREVETAWFRAVERIDRDLGPIIP